MKNAFVNANYYLFTHSLSLYTNNIQNKYLLVCFLIRRYVKVVSGHYFFEDNNKVRFSCRYKILIQDVFLKLF